MKEKALIQLIETVHRLRAPGGCPWDRAQTHQSLRQYLIEEAYEVLDVLDQIHSVSDLNNEKVRLSFKEELGDLLLQVILHSEMTQEAGAFDIFDVAQGLNDKLIRRHPHVFGDSQASSAEVALQRWEKEKAKEKASQATASVLDGMPRNLPALQKTTRIIEKVTKVGFQWDDMEGPLSKLDEELEELKVEAHELENLKKSSSSSEQIEKAHSKVEAELGDLFFSLCNVAYLLKISPEDTLRKTLAKFEKRFRHVERQLKARGKSPEESNLAEMDMYWDEAKKMEKIQIWGLTGGIASGKSTVAKILAENGIAVIDADEITHSLLINNSQVQQSLQNRFGTSDRSKLREIVFKDPEAKKDLENILHPWIQIQSIEKMKEYSKNHKVIVYEASLLVETGRYRDLDGLIVVDTSPEIQKKRLIARNHFSPEMVDQILQSQTTQEERKKVANFIIDNSEDEIHLRMEVNRLISNRNWK